MDDRDRDPEEPAEPAGAGESGDGDSEAAEPAESGARRRWWMVGLVVLSVAAVVAALWLARQRGLASARDPGDAAPAVAQPRPERPAVAIDPVVGTGAFAQEGEVVDGAGEPVAGVAVTAELELGPGVDGAAPGLALDPVVVAVTGADGAMTLRGIDAGRYRLRVEGPEIFTAEVRFVDLPAAPIRLVVARRVGIEGVVKDGGQPVHDIEVSLTGPAGDGVQTTRTNQSGQFRFEDLPEGRYQVWAARDDRAAPAADLDRLGAGPFEPVLLELGPAAVVRGQVIDRDSGRGIPAAVRLLATTGSEPPRRGRADSAGNFAIGGVPAGRWTAEARAAGYIAVESVSFDVTVGGAGFVPRIEMAAGAVIEGRVVDADGAPIAEAQLTAVGAEAGLVVSEQAVADRMARFTGRSRGLAAGADRLLPRGELGVLLGPIPYPPPKGAGPVRVATIVDGERDAGVESVPEPPPELVSRFVTDTDGRFRIAGLPAGRYQLRAAHRDFADARSGELAVTLGQRRSGVELVMVPGVIVTGSVTDDAGAAIVGATVVAERGLGDRDRLQAVTGTDGRYRLGPVGGDALLRVSAALHGEVERRLAVGKLAGRVVERTEDFVLLRADAGIRGRVVDGAGFPVRGAVIALVGRPGDGAGPATTSGPDGRFELAGLTRGRHRLAVRHTDFPAVEREAGTDQPAEIELPFGGGIDALVRDGHTRAPLAGVTVVASGPGGARWQELTGEDGALELAPLAAGDWKLELRTDGYVPRVETVRVTAGDRPGEVTVRGAIFELYRGATVAGVVRDEAGDRVRGARVSIGLATAVTDEYGAFRLTDVATGEVELAAEREGKRGIESLTLAPGDERVTLQIVIR